jgi:hypothetical protein
VRGVRARWVRGVYRGHSRRTVRTRKATAKTSTALPASNIAKARTSARSSTSP